MELRGGGREGGREVSIDRPWSLANTNGQRG